jgi:FKBP-type peptidyl-prolyl cis-trans isomerase FkpA
MKSFLRGTAALLLAVAGPALAGPQDAGSQAALDTDHARDSYAVGVDVGRSLEPIAAQLDFASFDRELRQLFDSGKPSLTPPEAQQVDNALRATLAAGSGMPGAPESPPALDHARVGQLVGGYIVGPSLAPIAGDIDMAVFMRGVRDAATGKPLALPADQVQPRLEAFGARVRARAQQAASAVAAEQKVEGDAFLAKNRQVKGVFTTPSGLQYMVLRQGNGPRPKPTDTVRVNYEGKLLDGTVFDSSYERGEPAEFPLNGVIPGWTEGLGLMPVGAKYRLWIPGDLGYGAKGTPGGPIAPNATLVFDVELLAIPQ